ncbi:uncharacterized protein BT62DRAFT_1011103 [Guyanagaster necrorhizus]|uniref:Uncharacterized protein n=1 Tax=Guyanagaster necrorhizus TaxID=856835 RepID=A0A9P7VJR3_9AGAR|nr:uncharacterized protein BT62DRAFT_1011103 [Guyanagaster necrorhizus MCA 3950]KAG7441805.1 hypothetical protein BT62DRAFT_1011103 [Guyanagaster necrorhizus MCA 3950]
MSLVDSELRGGRVLFSHRSRDVIPPLVGIKSRQVLAPPTAQVKNRFHRICTATVDVTTQTDQFRQRPKTQSCHGLCPLGPRVTSAQDYQEVSHVHQVPAHKILVCPSQPLTLPTCRKRIKRYHGGEKIEKPQAASQSPSLSCRQSSPTPMWRNSQPSSPRRSHSPQHFSCPKHHSDSSLTGIHPFPPGSKTQRNPLPQRRLHSADSSSTQGTSFLSLFPLFPLPMNPLNP